MFGSWTCGRKKEKEMNLYLFSPPPQIQDPNKTLNFVVGLFEASHFLIDQACWEETQHFVN